MDQLRFCTNPKCLQLYKELRRPRRVEAVKHSQKDIPKIPPYHRDCAVLLQKSELRGEEWIRFSNFLEGRRVDVRMSFEWEKWGACQIAQTLAGSQLLTKKCLLSSSSNFPFSKRLSVNFLYVARVKSQLFEQTRSMLHIILQHHITTSKLLHIHGMCVLLITKMEVEWFSTFRA